LPGGRSCDAGRPAGCKQSSAFAVTQADVEYITKTISNAILYFDLTSMRLTATVDFDHTAYSVNVSFLPTLPTRLATGTGRI
jgi:hypothetical protein